jgi:hypothetical protein
MKQGLYIFFVTTRRMFHKISAILHVNFYDTLFSGGCLSLLTFNIQPASSGRNEAMLLKSFSGSGRTKCLWKVGVAKRS